MSDVKSLPASYFEGIFSRDSDPWSLASSRYEAAKHTATIAALGGRRYRHGLEIGCAGGVLTRKLAFWCETFLATDISPSALAQARQRCGDLGNVGFEERNFPRWTDDQRRFDLIVVSEVAYYWDAADLAAAAARIREFLQSGGDIVLVHWTGATDYPQSGDAATEALRSALANVTTVVSATTTPHYRLDLWRRS
ncbi:hypothetical protein IP69_13020 [Bosea sp. AAP35]|uniref:SAM-dependent methyltransferase n=1 Tax=Bosea sp. AAP35 TaxID=1523417 RepID=UPI0006B89158|nr:SAM-dependent methyltransferase [Bosea sp. AAP35]KPF67617.1 hypothetical protein IP69_13020 [Bosea sp. AAP35]